LIWKTRIVWLPDAEKI